LLRAKAKLLKVMALSFGGLDLRLENRELVLNMTVNWREILAVLLASADRPSCPNYAFSRFGRDGNGGQICGAKRNPLMGPALRESG
jgi:hypothetical protein